MKSDIEIARSANLRLIQDVALEKLGISADHLENYGRHKAKVRLNYLKSLEQNDPGKLILVTAITPTPAGEGKTTTTVGLGDALNRIGRRAMICLREPSLGPCFGMKGGAAGGGFAQVVPMEDINLHFTGDMHAIGSANNLLAAMIDNHIYWGNHLDIDLRRVTWRRAVDMNDRSLRGVISSVGGVGNGYPREAGFDITVASEVMAILCLSDSVEDLQRRLNQIVIGYTRDRKPVCAGDIEASGAMTVLLGDALMPNLVQTLENNPAFVHGGPFANIAHGCNSVIATKAALNLSDYVVTEAGFGADLGAEKFFNIKCRKAGLTPAIAVIVATVRALKMHGGVAKEALCKENTKAVIVGCGNLHRHIENVQGYGIPVVVAINRFSSDSESEIDAILSACAENGVEGIEANHWADGGAGAQALAETVVKVLENEPSRFKMLYEDSVSLWEKTRTIARRTYRADDIIADKKIRDRFKQLEDEGYGLFPICMAKTQYSFSTDPNLKNAPTGFSVPVREVRLSGGAEFVVVVCGDVMTMPGLPRVPAANAIRFDEQGKIVGLF